MLGISKWVNKTSEKNIHQNKFQFHQYLKTNPEGASARAVAPFLGQMKINGDLFCILLNLHYLCSLYGIELYMDCVFHHCVRHRGGEIGVLRRLRCVSGHDGFDVLIVEDRL